MKKILILVGLSFFLISPTFAETIQDYDLSCFSETYTSSFQANNESILVESNKKNLTAIQNNTILPIANYNAGYRYIGFTSNIPSEKNPQKENTYIFSSIDTAETKEILIEVDDSNLAGRFSVNFLYEMRYHTPKYYISEDGETYYLVGARNLDEFQTKYFKIELISTSEEEKREIIHIKKLEVRRDASIYSVGFVKPNSPITFYANYTCSRKWKKETIGYGPIPEASNYFIDTHFSKNYKNTLKNTDTDNDGINDLIDNCKNIKNSDQKDVNQNLVGDVCEFDTDNDGIADEIDNCRNTSNPEQFDDDHDGIGNICDNCKLYNPSQIDTDNNGIGDRCDYEKTFLINNDDDNDGIINAQDNCKAIANSDQRDDDNDGVGNSCDNCRTFQNFDQMDFNKNGIGDICEDSDGDGIEGLQDNCRNIANPDQKDDDNDGIGNVCEDDDYDGIIFAEDNCPYKRNSNQLDTDKDGLGDVCDEDDNRFLESNKTIFILLMLLIMAGFTGAIVMMAKKLKK